MASFYITKNGSVKKCSGKCKHLSKVHYPSKKSATSDARDGVVVKVDKQGVHSWFRSGVLHRGHGLPAVVTPQGMFHFYINGVIYRSTRKLSKNEKKNFGKKTPKYY